MQVPGTVLERNKPQPGLRTEAEIRGYRGQRKGQGEDGTSAQKHEFQHHAQTKALTHKLVDIHPEELHHQDEYHHKEDRDKRSYESLEYEPVEPFHALLEFA